MDGQGRRIGIAVVTKSAATAASARARIEAGEDWASVARDLSSDRDSRRAGGKLVNVTERPQGRRLGRAFFSARIGEVAGPVRTASGWYVFKVKRIKPPQRQSLAEARDTIASLLESRKLQRLLDAYIREFTAKWTARTICRKGYRTVDCANGPAPDGPKRNMWALQD